MRASTALRVTAVALGSSVTRIGSIPGLTSTPFASKVTLATSPAVVNTSPADVTGVLVSVGALASELGEDVRRYIVADVEPLDVDGVRTVAVGTGLWLLAFVMLLPFYGRLEEAGRLDWLWTCVAGFGLGVLGWDYCRRRRRSGE